MNALGLWISPLLILPGCGLLIMSTSARFTRLHEELHHMMHGEQRFDCDIVHQFGKRAVLFRNALVSLYGAVGFLSLAGLLGGIAETRSGGFQSTVFSLTCIGILLLIVASVLLVRESTTSLDVIRDHIKELNNSPTKQTR